MGHVAQKLQSCLVWERQHGDRAHYVILSLYVQAQDAWLRVQPGRTQQQMDDRICDLVCVTDQQKFVGHRQAHLELLKVLCSVIMRSPS